MTPRRVLLWAAGVLLLVAVVCVCGGMSPVGASR